MLFLWYFKICFCKEKRPQIEHDVGYDVIKLATKFNHGDASHAWLSGGGAMAGDQSNRDRKRVLGLHHLQAGLGSGRRSFLQPSAAMG